MTQYEYGAYGRVWGTVEATDEKDARRQARERWNLRTTKGMTFTETTDRTGHTEREWEQIWSSKNRDDGAQTAHMSRFDNEDYCEECDQTVDYSDGSKHGKCGCN